MKIQYLPPSPLAGQTAHLQPQRAQGLIDAGFAVAVPLPPRGSREWLQAMRENEQERIALIPEGQRQESSTVPTWGLKFLESSHRYVIVRTLLTESLTFAENTLMDGKGRPDPKRSQQQFVESLKTAGCPDAIVKQYIAAKNAPDFLAAEAARIEQDKRNAAAQREREKHAPRFI
jgi:hypothetical protein